MWLGWSETIQSFPSWLLSLLMLNQSSLYSWAHFPQLFKQFLLSTLPNVLWIAKIFLTVDEENKKYSQPWVNSGIVTFDNFWCFFPWSWVISSPACANQYSGADLRLGKPSTASPAPPRALPLCEVLPPVLSVGF